MSRHDTFECRTVALYPDAAEILGLSRNVVYDSVKRGELPVIRMGRTVRVPVPVLEKMLGGPIKPIAPTE
jgi:excisionase family DNA binding protein